MEETNYLLALILPIATKYLDITTYALRSECRYFMSRIDYYHYSNAKEYNKKILEKRGIKHHRHYRKNLTLSIMLDMFYNGKWEKDYGGRAWGDICQAGIELNIAIKNLNLKQILEWIDILNDLEHNNALYLQTYSTFDLPNSLGYKRYSEPAKIFKYCSYDIQKLTKGINI